MFLWRFFSTVGLYLTIPYDDLGDPERPLSADEPPNPLDEIDSKLVGACRLDRVLSAAKIMDLDFTLEAVGWTNDISALLTEPNTSNLNKHTPTSQRYTAHFKSLLDWGILKKVNGTGFLQWISKYFSIAKNALLERSIFNGRSLSRQCQRPPPVNLPGVPETIGELDALNLKSKGKLILFLSDVRHWFHQIRVSRKVQAFFGVCMKNERGDNDYYSWQTLPMGFAYSPRICQCIAWTLIIFNGTDLSDNRDGLRTARLNLRRAKDPPRFVHIRNDQEEVVGICTLTYDNVMIACTDEKIWAFLANRVINTFELFANVTLKEKSFFPSARLKETFHLPCVEFGPEVERAVHLGVEYALSDADVLVWRHNPTKMTKWRDLGLQIRDSRTSWTCRGLAKVCGIIIWHKTITLVPLCFCRKLIHTLRCIAGSVGTVTSNWDKPHHPDADTRNYLAEELSDILTNDWNHLRIVNPTTSTILFTDASKRRMGCVVCDIDGRVWSVNSGVFPNEIHESDIFIKELFAAVMCVTWTLRRRQLRNCCIHLGIDNSAAIFALNNWYSSSATACEFLSRLHNALMASVCTLQPFLIGTDDNPADTPSRGSYDVCKFRLRYGLTAFRQHMKGLRFSSSGTRIYEVEDDVDSVLRHKETYDTCLEKFDATRCESVLLALDSTQKTGLPRRR